jgi:hypothetical protein
MTLNIELVIPMNIVSATTILITRISPSSFVVHGKKTKMFNGLDFKKWQHELLFYMTTLNLAKFLLKKVLKLSNNKFDSIIVVALDVWNHELINNIEDLSK